MTRNRKKLKMRTKTSVSSAAASFPASQRKVTAGPLDLELDRLVRALAPAAQRDRQPGADRRADCDEHEHDRAPAALVLRRRGGHGRRERGERRAGDLLADRV